MPTRRGKDGRWRYRKVVHLPDGSTMRISGSPDINTRLAAEAAERAHIERALKEAATPGLARREVPTLDTWFNGRFWNEWVVGRKNKPSEVESKKSIYKIHLKDTLGERTLDEIGVGEVAGFRASLVKKKLSDKRINNVLTVLSKALRYAADVEVITRAPKVGLFKVERPEILSWEIEEYARILDAAKGEGDVVLAAVALAGEAGLRVGEVKALRWREDVDMVARTITINRQMRRGVFGTPKGRTRRTVPMTETLHDALRRLPAVREGLVVRGVLGEAKNEENQVKNLMYRVCRKAGLPERGWHSLRHSFGTHAALFGVNPWRLMTWLGHKRVDETMLYVHVASAHQRELPRAIVEAAATAADPDRRILAMLGARRLVPWQAGGKQTEAERQPLRIVRN